MNLAGQPSVSAVQTEGELTPEAGKAQSHSHVDALDASPAPLTSSCNPAPTYMEASKVSSHFSTLGYCAGPEPSPGIPREDPPSPLRESHPKSLLWPATFVLSPCLLRELLPGPPAAASQSFSGEC